MQLRYATDLSAEEYVRQKAWKDAKLGNCPIHPKEKCGFTKNGTYKRKFPDGTKIARWYCPDGHQTFSFLIVYLRVYPDRNRIHSKCS